MSVVGPFILLGTTAFFLSFARDPGGDDSVIAAFGASMIVGGSLGLSGVTVDHLRRSGRLDTGRGVALLALAMILIAVAGFGTARPGRLGVWMVVVVSAGVVLHFARSSDALARPSLMGFVARRWSWLSVVALITLYTLTFMDVNGSARTIPLGVLVGAACAAVALVVEMAMRYEHMRRLFRRAESARAPSAAQVRGVEELGVGEGWYRLGREPAPYRGCAGTWMHGDPERAGSAVRRFLWCAGVTAAVALVALALPEPPEPATKPEPPDPGTPFVPLRGSSCEEPCARRCPYLRCWSDTGPSCRSRR